MGRTDRERNTMVTTKVYFIRHFAGIDTDQAWRAKNQPTSEGVHAN